MCRLFGAESFSKAVAISLILDRWKRIQVKFYSKFKHFHGRKWAWKCRVQYVSHYIQASWPQNGVQPRRSFQINDELAFHIHNNDVIMGAMASQITRLTIVHSTVYQRKYQSNAPKCFHLKTSPSNMVKPILLWWHRSGDIETQISDCCKLYLINFLMNIVAKQFNSSKLLKYVHYRHHNWGEKKHRVSLKKRRLQQSCGHIKRHRFLHLDGC